MHAAESNIAIMPAGARSVTKASTTKLISFAQALPRIRRRVAADLRRRGLPREKVLAAVVKLLETTLVRVGNDEYAETNNSFGLTTMRDRHAEVTRTKARIEFKGKSGVDHEVDIRDPQARKNRQPVPGPARARAVPVRRRDGVVHDIGSDDVNKYLQRHQRPATSRPRTSGPGPALPWPRKPCKSLKTSIRTPPPSATSPKQSSASRRDSEIPRLSAASAIFTLPLLMRIWIGRWSERSKSEPRASSGNRWPSCRRKRRPCWRCSSSGWSARWNHAIPSPTAPPESRRRTAQADGLPDLLESPMAA